MDILLKYLIYGGEEKDSTAIAEGGDELLEKERKVSVGKKEP